MSAVLLGLAEVHSPEWHELRSGGIGGSEIAAVVGLSRWASPFALWHRKKGNIPEEPTNPRMEWGLRLEPVIAEKFATEHPELEVTPTPGTYAHEDRLWQRCNPDGLAGADALLQVKNVSEWADDWTKDSCPLEVQCQVQHEMDIFGYRRSYVAALIGGNDYREYVVEANPQDQATLRNAADAFWTSIANDDEPPLDATDHTYQAVRELNPAIDKDLLVDLPSEMWAAYLNAKADKTNAEAALVLAQSQLLQFMGQARVARFAGLDVLRRQMSGGKTPKPYLREIA